MKLLVDIVHPADVLFFINPIIKLRRMGHEVSVVSREKDVTLALLDQFGVEHQCISRAGTGLLGLAAELLHRDRALLKIVRQIQPDVMCGFGGVAISHVGKIVGIPSVSFYDTERAPLQQRLTLPFISHLYVPESYDGPVAKNRTTTFPGTKDFSYLHPDNFKPERAKALEAGLDPDRRNFFIRLVAWQANHDLGYRGWSEDTLRQLLDFLSGQGKVHLSSETPLPGDIQHYAFSGPVHTVQHLLAFCDSYIGESATMAGEAVLLGVPPVYAASDRRCYTDDLAARQLLWKVTEVSFSSIKLALDEISSLDQAAWKYRIHDYRSRGINLADYVVDVLLHHGKKRPD